MNPSPIVAAAGLALGCISLTPAFAEPPAHLMLTPDQLKWVDVASIPAGAQLAVIEGPLNQAAPFTFRLKLPANYDLPAHWHPAIEHVTVISGIFNMGAGSKLDRSQTMALTSGSVAIMQPGTHHYAWTDQQTVIQVHGMGPWAIHYVNPADDPRNRQ